MNEIGRAISVGLSLIQDRFHGGPIAETDRRPGRVHGELADEVSRQLTLIGDEQPFEVFNAGELLAGWQLAVASTGRAS